MTSVAVIRASSVMTAGVGIAARPVTENADAASMVRPFSPSGEKDGMRGFSAGLLRCQQEPPCSIL
jgi:hypothetical protein